MMQRKLKIDIVKKKGQKENLFQITIFLRLLKFAIKKYRLPQ